MNIYTEITSQGKEIVLLHGWGCDHTHMQPLMDHLSKHYKVININLPGSGKSDWAGQQSIEEIADSLLAILPEKAVYIGWSFGGSIAASIAARYPERVTQFIGIATTPKFVEDKGWPGLPEPGFKAGFAIYTDDDFKELLTGFTEGEYQYFSEKPDSYDQLKKINQSTQSRDLSVLKQGVDIIDDTDLRKEYQDISCQIDLILGAKDGSIPIAVHPKIKSLNSNVRVHVIEAAQHMPFWTHQDEFFKILDSVIKTA